jgi:hypothetical protein
MDEAARVLARLSRIEELRDRGAAFGAAGPDGVGPGGAGCGGSAPELLAELRALVPDAEAWARAEGDERARTAATKLREEAGGMS